MMSVQTTVILTLNPNSSVQFSSEFHTVTSFVITKTFPNALVKLNLKKSECRNHSAERLSNLPTNYCKIYRKSIVKS